MILLTMLFSSKPNSNMLLRFFGRRLTTAAFSKFCIVGSGPAGFYCAHGLLKVSPSCRVDFYEKLPVPFGLVRYGVAPDHPDVKNVTNTFTATARNENVSFFGNVDVGKDVSVKDLLEAYHAVILCSGAEDDKHLNVPGETLLNVLSARSFVGWYNGLPASTKLNINLDVESAAVIGHGNVALDVARILLTSVDDLKKTDIAEHALETLARSRIKKVSLIGRRGALQVSFTIKEFREMTKLRGCYGTVRSEDLSDLNDRLIKELPRPRRRLTELMLKQSVVEKKVESREWDLVFCRSPVRFEPAVSDSRSVGRICLVANALQDSLDNPRVVPTDVTEMMDYGLVLKSIGYRSVPIDGFVPFDTTKGVVANENGYVTDRPGLYCCGWTASGPVGVIVNTVDNSYVLSRTIGEHIRSGKLEVDRAKGGATEILKQLQNKGVQFVTFADWEKIDSVERSRGSKVGKPREKITSIEEMLTIASH